MPRSTNGASIEISRNLWVPPCAEQGNLGLQLQEVLQVTSGQIREPIRPPIGAQRVRRDDEAVSERLSIDHHGIRAVARDDVTPFGARKAELHSESPS